MTVEAERIVVSRGVALILLLSSAITGVIGMALLLIYEGSVAYYHVAVFYPALYVGIMNFSACILGVVGGVALLKRRFFPLTLAAIFLLLASGIAAPIAWSLGGYIWLNGLFLGAFQIGVSIISLIFLAVRKAEK